MRCVGAVSGNRAYVVPGFDVGVGSSITHTSDNFQARARSLFIADTLASCNLILPGDVRLIVDRFAPERLVEGTQRRG